VKFSVVTVTYKRLDTLEPILRAWLEEADEVILCDCSGKFETELPITHVRFNPDLGNKTMHAMALLTQGDFVVLADDDFLPKPGLIQDLYNGYKKVGGDAIVGIMGRRFGNADSYWHTMQIWADKISQPVQTDMIGICYLSPRKYLAYDLKGMENPINDLYWTMYKMRDVKKFVVPTTNLLHLAVSEEGIWTDKHRQEYRCEWYKKMFDKYYRR